VTQTVREDGRITAPFLDEPIVALGKTPEMVREALRFLYSLRRYDPILDLQNADHRQYVLGVGDALDVQFEKAPEFNEHVTIRPDGKITLGRVKTVQAEGRTPEELQKELTEKFKAFMAEPALVVSVGEASSSIVYVDGVPTRLGLRNLDQVEVLVRRQTPQLVYVTGEVDHPGFFPYRSPMTTLRAIITAGGYKRSARLDSVIILRKVGTNEPAVLKVDLVPEIRGDATTDIALRPNDVVIVPKTCITKVQDVMDQYVYNLFPQTRNLFFSFIYDINPSTANINSSTTTVTGR
jgi:polysaccharide export outer membrane protein